MKKNIGLTLYIFLFVIVVLFSLAILISKSFSHQHEQHSQAYTSFVSSVQNVETLLDQLLAASSDDAAVQMFDVYNQLIFVHKRLDLLREYDANKGSFDRLENDFLSLSFHYSSLVRSEVAHRESFDPEVQQRLKHQIALLLQELPDKYERTKDFRKQLNKASEHINSIMLW